MLTDSSGRFSFVSLPSGAFLLRAQKQGYAESRYGQRRFKGAGTPIVVEADSAYSAVIRIAKFGAISGEVLDENRLGLPGVAVYAYRSGTPLKMVGGAPSDDRGVFRIAGLEPGKYLVRTAPRELEDREGLLPTFFGQSARAQTARTVEVRLEEESGNVIIEPLRGRLSAVVGTLSAAVSAEVELHLDTGKREQRVEAGGQFTFDQLAPGEYELFAKAEGQAGYLKFVLAKELESVVVDLGPAPQLRVKCEERNGNGFDPRRIALFARQKDRPAETAAERVSCGQAAILGPGLWEIAAAPPADLYVFGLRGSGDGLTTSQTFEVRLMPGQVRDLTIIVSTRPAKLDGTVTMADGTPAIGAPVYLIPVDAELAVRVGGMRTARTDQNGEYHFVGLAPGRYEIVASFDPQAETLVAGQGTTVRLEEGKEESVRIRLAEIE